jgi:hypothetical protein
MLTCASLVCNVKKKLSIRVYCTHVGHAIEAGKCNTKPDKVEIFMEFGTDEIAVLNPKSKGYFIVTPFDNSHLSFQELFELSFHCEH